MNDNISEKWFDINLEFEPANPLADQWIDVDLDFDDETEPYLGEIETLDPEDSALKLLNFTKDLYQLKFSLDDLRGIKESCHEHPSIITKSYISLFPKPIK
jgi:hypothetical protein